MCIIREESDIIRQKMCHKNYLKLDTIIPLFDNNNILMYACKLQRYQILIAIKN